MGMLKNVGCLILGVFLVICGCFQISAGLASQNWPSATATVASCKERDTVYDLAVRYSVDAKTHTAELKGQHEPHAVGELMTVYYNPSKLEDVALTTGVYGASYFALIFGLFVTLGGFLGIVRRDVS